MNIENMLRVPYCIVGWFGLPIIIINKYVDIKFSAHDAFLDNCH